VETSSSGASCGIETTVGQRIGLFLGREAGRWSGNLCAQVAGEDLLAAAALPAPNGRGDVAILVGGRFGPGRTLALDAQGRTLAYGMGAGRLSAFSVCPGGSRVAEIAQLGSRYTLTLRELSTLRLIRQQRLELSYPSSLRCQSASGEQLVVFSGSGPDLERRARLVRITPGSTTTIWRGTSWHAALAVRYAYVTEVGGSLLAVDLRTRAVKKLAPTTGGAHYLTPNPARTRFASLAFTEGVGRPRLVIVDTRRRPASVRVVPLTNATGDVLWLARGRLALLQNPTALVFDSELRVVSRFRWQAEDGTLVGPTAFGVRGNGRLVSAQLPSGPTRPIRRLPGRPHLIVSAANSS
ncbi:MAG: hypothetical protein H0U82_07235, partial [Actinobacteria bacterium]|nr:hypothetical protein [Actinomycetota bacterium]